MRAYVLSLRVSASEADVASGDLKAGLWLLALGHLDSHSLPWNPTWWTVVVLQIQGEAIPATPSLNLLS